MKTYLSLELTHAEALPAAFQDNDVRYPESLVEHFLQEYTQKGDTVLDPFAGYGTTLIVAERMGRMPFGVELDEAKVHYARSKLTRPENLRLGDSRSLAGVDLPKIDFSMTSPPYMNRNDPEDPLTAYRTKGKNYTAYLQDLRGIYEQLRWHMKPTGTIVLEVAKPQTGWAGDDTGLGHCTGSLEGAAFSRRGSRLLGQVRIRVRSQLLPGVLGRVSAPDDVFRQTATTVRPRNPGPTDVWK